MSLRFGRTSSLLILIPALLFLTSCDSDSLSEGGPVTLTTDITVDTQNQPIRFTIVANNYVEDQPQDVRCNCDIDISAFLESQGFIKDEIISATVTAARVEILFPVGQQLSFLTGAKVKFEGPKLTIAEIASQTGFPEAREVSMTVAPNQDIAGFLVRDEFEVYLEMTPNTLVVDETYELGLVLTVQIVMTGA